MKSKFCCSPNCLFLVYLKFGTFLSMFNNIFAFFLNCVSIHFSGDNYMRTFATAASWSSMKDQSHEAMSLTHNL